MSEETTTAVFNLEVVMLACEGKLSLHEENHACSTQYIVCVLFGFSTTLAQDVSAANVGSIATLSHTRIASSKYSSHTLESAFSTFRANWLLPSLAFPVIRYVERCYTKCIAFWLIVNHNCRIQPEGGYFGAYLLTSLFWLYLVAANLSSSSK